MIGQHACVREYSLQARGHQPGTRHRRPLTSAFPSSVALNIVNAPGKIIIVSNCAHIVGGFSSTIGIGFNGAETNCGIAHILGILLMNS